MQADTMRLRHAAYAAALAAIIAVVALVAPPAAYAQTLDTTAGTAATNDISKLGWTAKLSTEGERLYYETSNSGNRYLFGRYTTDKYGVTRHIIWYEPNGSIKESFDTDGSHYKYNNGEPIEPLILVNRGDGNWTSVHTDLEYKIVYENNVNAGWGTATVVGTGVYTGSLAPIKFRIDPASINEYSLASKFTKTVKLSKKKLKKKAVTVKLSKNARKYFEKKYGVKTKWVIDKDFGKKGYLKYGNMRAGKNVKLNAKKGTVTFKKIKFKKGSYSKGYVFNIPVSLVITGGNPNYEVGSTIRPDNLLNIKLKK